MTLGHFFVHDPDLFAGMEPDEAVRAATYLYGKPGNKSLRSRVLALYDPFARRNQFPAGFRLCANVYTGCAHRCGYCYTASYVPDHTFARPKQGFERMLARDLEELAAARLLPVPLHTSNSTDGLQEAMEARYGHTLRLLRGVASYRHLFDPVVVLTKNPSRLLMPEYLEALKSIGRVIVEVSLIFADDRLRRRVEPGAPSVQQRLDAIAGLVHHGIPVVLRLDPLFPRDPLPRAFFSRSALADYGVTPVHTEQDIAYLLDHARTAGVRKVVISPAKLVLNKRDGSHREPPPFWQEWLRLYRACRGSYAKGFCLHLAREYAQDHLLRPVAELGRELGLTVVHCKHNLLNTLPSRSVPGDGEKI